MTDALAVFYVFFVLFARGLTVPIKEHANDQVVTTVANTQYTSLEETNMSNDKEDNDPMVTSSQKKAFSRGDRLLNRIKERSVVKIIKTCKRPRYKLRDSILENDLFSILGPLFNNNTLAIHEVYRSEEQPKEVIAKSSPILNKTFMMDVPLSQRKNELISTSLLPVKIFANDSDIELVKNTYLQVSVPNKKNYNMRKEINKGNNTKNSDQSKQEVRSGKHQVRKYFRLHSANVKELDETSNYSKNTRSALSKLSGFENNLDKSLPNALGSTDPSHQSIVGEPHDRVLLPRKQSIMMRWNVILV